MIKNNIQNRINFALILLTLLFASMNGAKLGIISLTKIALIPLALVLILNFNRKNIKNKSAQLLFCYFAIILLSSLLGLLRGSFYQLEDYETKLTNNIFQMVFLYLPICLLTMGAKNEDKICDSFHKAFVVLARINCIWAISQFVMWSLFRLDINSYIFVDIFKGFFGTDWSAFNSQFNGTTYIQTIRVSGLNPDSASLALVLLMGYLFDNNKKFKYLYVVSIIFSMSRAGFVLFFFLIAKQVYRNFKDGRIKKKYLLSVFGFICLGFVMLYIILFTDMFPGVLLQVRTLFDRFWQIKSIEKTSGTYYHIMYLLWAIECLVLYLDPFAKIFGLGFRVSGICFTMIDSAMSVLPSARMSRAWSIENDYSDILIGQGILGLFVMVMFFKEIYKIRDIRIRDFICCYAIFGFLYNPSAWTITHVIFFYLALEFSKYKKEKRQNDKV